MKRRNSFAPHLPKPALLPLLVLLALPPCTSKAGFLQEFYDDASLQSSYTAPGLYASASMDTVTGGRFILKANREDFHPYYLQGPELKAGCGGIDVFLGAFSIPSKDEFVSFVRSIGTALPCPGSPSMQPSSRSHPTSTNRSLSSATCSCATPACSETPVRSPRTS